MSPVQEVVLNDLKQLSNEEGQDNPKREPESQTRLQDLCDDYHVLFIAYRAVFALLPSASSIVESAHGIVQYRYDPNVPQEYLNAVMRYTMNIDHDMKEACKKVVREKSDGSAKKRRAAKHCDRKETQQMLGEQLMALVEKYSATLLHDLPDNVKRRMCIRNINRRSAMTIEENLKWLKDDKAVSLRERRKETRDEKSLDEFRELAKETMTEHDKGWALRGEREEVAVMKKCSKRSFEPLFQPPSFTES